MTAYWTYPSIDYVSPLPPLESSLFDDPKRLKESWDRALETMRAQVELTAQDLAEVELLLAARADGGQES